jgi:hypothetical protein
VVAFHVPFCSSKFIASFDLFGMACETLSFVDCGKSIKDDGRVVIIAWRDFRLYSDWYDVVMVVVTVGDHRSIVRYSEY